MASCRASSLSCTASPSRGSTPSGGNRAVVVFAHERSFRASSRPGACRPHCLQLSSSRVMARCYPALHSFASGTRRAHSTVRRGLAGRGGGGGRMRLVFADVLGAEALAADADLVAVVEDQPVGGPAGDEGLAADAADVAQHHLVVL